MPFDHAHFESFDAFKEAFLPHVRPEGTLERMRRAFEIDVAFLEEFRLLRPILRRREDDWAGLIIEHVSRARSAHPEAFDSAQRGTFDYIYRRHMAHLIAGKFDAEYLSSVETVALFMIYRDIKSVWMAAAYQRVVAGLLDHVYDRVEKHRVQRMLRLTKVASKALAIEMNQVQRVFSTVETWRIEAMSRGAAGSALAGGAPPPPAAAAALVPPPGPKYTTRQMEIVQESFERIAPHAEIFARKFYTKLFELAPELSTMFPADLDSQCMRLAEALGPVVAGLSDFPALAPRVSALGRRHADYGAKPEHYEAVGAAFLGTLQHALGPRWTPELEEAWTAVYATISTLMITAQEGR